MKLGPDKDVKTDKIRLFSGKFNTLNLRKFQYKRIRLNYPRKKNPRKALPWVTFDLHIQPPLMDMIGLYAFRKFNIIGIRMYVAIRAHI